MKVAAELVGQVEVLVHGEKQKDSYARNLHYAASLEKVSDMLAPVNGLSAHVNFIDRKEELKSLHQQQPDVLIEIVPKDTLIENSSQILVIDPKQVTVSILVKEDPNAKDIALFDQFKQETAKGKSQMTITVSDLPAAKKIAELERLSRDYAYRLQKKVALAK